MASKRLTNADLLLWNEYAVADTVHAKSESFQKRVDEAKRAIAEFVSGGNSCYAGTSWGKDSTVLCYLLREVAPQIPLMHLRPTNHNPDCDAVRDAYFALFPGQSYAELPVDYSAINRCRVTAMELDRLTDQRWYAAISDYGKKFGGRHILGIRSGESTGRLIRMCRWGLNSPNASAPIGRWSTQDVFAALSRFNLPIHPAYAMLGGGRWPRDRIRVTEIGDTHGTGGGRKEWEQEYYGDSLRRVESRVTSR